MPSKTKKNTSKRQSIEGKAQKTKVNKERKKNSSNSSRCDLIFPVGRTHRLFKQGRYADAVGLGGAIFTAAVLEYITCEILELAGNAAEELKKKTI